MTSQAVLDLTGALCPSCGRYAFGKKARDTYKQAGREAYTMKGARQELADKGLLPNSCVKSWTNCDRYLADQSTKCRQEKTTFQPLAEQWIAEHGAAPSPMPTAGPNGWTYPASWAAFKDYGIDVSTGGSMRDRALLDARVGQTGGAASKARNILRNVGPLLAPPTAPDEPMTSDMKVAIGLGIGVLLLVGGVWWAKSKKTKRAKKDED